MNQDWPTREQDLAIANQLIRKYHDYNDGEMMALLEVLISEKETVSYRYPAWVQEMTWKFCSQYGAVEGAKVANRIITGVLIGDEKVH